MDIYAKKGTRVKFERSTPEMVQWGGNDDPDLILRRGQIYTVDHTEPHSSHTKVYFKEVPGKKFNSCSFSEVKPKNP